MMVKPPDLTRTYPRSPKERLGGYLHLGRMIDKARAKASQTAGEYIFPCPLDQSLLEYLGIRAEDFYRAVLDRDDTECLEWLRENAPRKIPEEIEAWNRKLLGRQPQSEESLRRFLQIRERIAPERTDVTAWVDLLDLEEGRPVPLRQPPRG